MSSWIGIGLPFRLAIMAIGKAPVTQQVRGVACRRPYMTEKKLRTARTPSQRRNGADFVGFERARVLADRTRSILSPLLRRSRQRSLALYGERVDWVALWNLPFASSEQALPLQS